MTKIAVIGAGTMGNGIAHVCALKGHNVHLVDISDKALALGISTIEKNLGRMAAKDLISQNEVVATLGRIRRFVSLSEGVKDRDLVIEAATEREDLKLKIFKELSEHCSDDTIMASNTSSISITRIASVTKRPDKVIGMHFFNPVPVMKLVEIIKGYSTSEETCQRINALSVQLDKIPIQVNDYPGFVSNRILMPMLNEAIYTLHEGIAGVEEIDAVMRLGMAHPMGPLQLADFVGLDVCLNICEVLHKGFGNPKYAPCPLLVNMVAAGKLGRKSGEGFYDYTNESKSLVVARRFR